ncbi:hypothetical protein BGZ57DRAFT_79578 [Hyaloscypha finlandica]|nr:hypothetical protein BGZ57DRAFT_79578 [Hyaloscypha finlandica]
MGTRSRKDSRNEEQMLNGNGEAKKLILVDEEAVDPSLALLFSSSAGPVKAPSKARYEAPPPPTKKELPREESDDESKEGVGSDGGDDVELSSVDENLEDVDIADLSENEEPEQDSDDSDEEPALDKIIEASMPERKRKRKAVEDDLEGKYMQKLAEEDEKEEEERQTERRLKRQRLMAEQDPNMSEESEDLDEGELDKGPLPGREPPLDVPLHESLAPSKDAIEVEKANRTVFLANVSTLAISSKSAKKTLLAHMASFLPSLPASPEGKPPHKVESLRFRSTAYATALPKKAAFAKKDLMAATTKSTNAYVVYSTAYAAREAAKRLNGTVILDRHLRVDEVAHPAKTDHRRCVFVGNLGFVDDESLLDQGGENERKRSKIPSDIEEGLWRQFSKAGVVESVRVVRDEKTRVGKGFAYVQFEDPNAVEAALLFNEKKYPPMLPRLLRVVRAKAVRKTALASASRTGPSKNAKPGQKSQLGGYNPRVAPEVSSFKGRASKLLGKAAAAQFKSGANGTTIGKRGDGGEERGTSEGRKAEGAKGAADAMRTPESIVFEGYRASSKSGKPRDLKLGGSGGGKKKGKPRTRGAKRGSEWKKAGGKKAK